MKKLITLLTLLSLTVLVSCGGGGGGGGNDAPPPTPPSPSQPYEPEPIPGPVEPPAPTSYEAVTYANDFVDMMNENMPVDASGSYIVKNGTEQAEYVVVWDDLLDEYVAYSLADFTFGSDWDTYQFDQIDESFIVAESGTDIYGNTAWVGNNGFGEVYFEDVTDQAKDLEKIGAAKEALAVEKDSKQLVEEFGLSHSRAKTVAVTLNQWNTISKSRSMTNADANQFSKGLLGVSIEDAKAAIQSHVEGDKSALSDLIEESADHNGISPEHMNKLILKFMSK